MRVLVSTLAITLALAAGLAVGQSLELAETESADVTVAAKLDQVLATQTEIIQRLDAIAEELQIIKVRASRSH